MKTPTGVRMRMALSHRRNLHYALLAAFGALLLVVFLLTRTPAPYKYDKLSDEEDKRFNTKVIMDQWQGKCQIKNFEQLRRMSIVYTWVNGSQPCYRQIREKAGGKKAVGGSRDREIGELKYSIRSLEKYVTWHTGQIYIVTPGHIPEWLDMNNPRIKVINQDNLFPDYAKEFLPTFNTHVIEQFLYLIPGLSDIFMQINDDYMFTKPIAPHEFFTCDGGIRLLHEGGKISHTPPPKKKGIWISSVLNTQQEMDLRWGKKDRHFIKHAPFVYSRRAFERVHQIFDRPLYMTLKSKFRSKPDMNNPLLHHYYMLAQGSEELGIPVYSPPEDEMSGYKLILMKNDNIDKLKQIFGQILDGSSPYSIIALNDEYSDMRVADTAREFLSKFLPEPSKFERKPDSKASPLTVRKPDTCEVDPMILPSLPRRVEDAPKYQVIAYREVRWVAFTNSLLRGFGFGLGAIIMYIVYLVTLRRKKALMGCDGAYDKV
ncbi:exopolysaccharide phosphotransferase [Plasmopara halstedii]|uniref:Exopolysaccharide phosphotransferase n=1 Tax=Plasmopara halstedii TaxID=4781 RepID=A0A0P1A4T8_PLAHL|nr:exopolysaccharide phosphotransferase [Plasmopara halstedii]CEG35165.1 exopolysaccharide phosphotransferase [Plasmopara halstedii]|eukprot:XP_024571534.1 exopolysaccharide phosphotransferase [Plasmopara halstedii]